jgi:hypothetical protein
MQSHYRRWQSFNLTGGAATQLPLRIPPPTIDLALDIERAAKKQPQAYLGGTPPLG